VKAKHERLPQEAEIKSRKGKSCSIDKRFILIVVAATWNIGSKFA